MGASPTRQPLQPEAIGAVTEVTKWLKPSISVSRIGDSASVQAATRVNAEQALYGLCQGRGVSTGDRSVNFFPSSVSLFDLRAVSSSRPALRLRWRAQKLSRLAVAPTLRQAPPLPGHSLTASSTTARFGSIGMTIRGEPACGRDQSRHNLVSGGSKDPNHDAVMRIGSEAPRRRTHSPFRH